MKGQFSILVLSLGVLLALSSLAQGQTPTTLTLRGVAVPDLFFKKEAKPTALVSAKITLNLVSSSITSSWLFFGANDEIGILLVGGVKGGPFTPLILFQHNEVVATFTDVPTIIRYMAFGEISFAAFTETYPTGFAVGDMQLDTQWGFGQLIPTADMLNGQTPLAGNVGRVFLGNDPSLPAPLLYVNHPGLVGRANLTIALLNSNGDVVGPLMTGPLKSPIVAHLAVRVPALLNAVANAKYLGVLDSSFNPLLLATLRSGNEAVFVASLRSPTPSSASGEVRLVWSRETRTLSWNGTFSNLSSSPVWVSLTLKSWNYPFLALAVLSSSGTSGNFTGTDTNVDEALVNLGLSLHDLSVNLFTTSGNEYYGEIMGDLKLQGGFNEPAVHQVCKGTWWLLNPNPYLVQFRYGKSKRFSTSFGFLNAGRSAIYSVYGSKTFSWSVLNNYPLTDSAYFYTGERKLPLCFQLKKTCQNTWNFTSSDFNSLRLAMPVAYQFFNPNTTLPVDFAYFYVFPKTSFNETLSFPGVNATQVKRVELHSDGYILKTVGNANNACSPTSPTPSP